MGTLNKLVARKAVISHPLKNQISYVKGIALGSRTNSDAIANLSNIIKSEIIQLHNHYTQLASDAWQFIVTFED
jgi:hypothetical protein